MADRAVSLVPRQQRAGYAAGAGRKPPTAHPRPGISPSSPKAPRHPGSAAAGGPRYGYEGRLATDLLHHRHALAVTDIGHAICAQNRQDALRYIGAPSAQKIDK